MKKSTSITLFFALLTLFGMSSKANAQTTIAVGEASTYKTIQSAYDAGITAPITGAFIIELQNDYNPTLETYPINLTAKAGASAVNSITIKPATGVTKTLICDNQTINLPGSNITSATSVTVADATGLTVNMTISGVKVSSNKTITAIAGNVLTLSGGGSTANLTDLFAGPTTGTTTIYLNGAQYVTFDGVSRTGSTQLIIDNPNKIASQSILFKNDASFNSIKNCTVKGSSAVGVSATTGSASDNGTIYFYTGNTTGNDNNTIDNCDIQDGVSMPVTQICSNGTSDLISNDNNTISNCNIDNSYITAAGSGAPGGIIISGSSNNTQISNNRIFWSKPMNPISTATMTGISTNATGTVITSNVIGFGTSTGEGLSTIPATASAATIAGIYVRGTATVTNNTIAGFDVYCLYFSGIWAGSSASETIISGNTIKNILTTTTSSTLALSGVNSQVNTNPITISNNTISGLTNVFSDGIVANTKGITHSGTGLIIVSQNNVSALTAGGPASTAPNEVTGIDFTKPIAKVERNLIFNLNSSSNNAVINGIKSNCKVVGNSYIKNNMIRLGTDVTSNAKINGVFQEAVTQTTIPNYYIYHNSIYIGGTAPAASTVSTYAYNRTATGNVGVIDLRNNILSNQRVVGGSEKNYAVGVAAAADIATCNYNIYQYNGQLGAIGATDKADLAAWKGALTPANDANSMVVDPKFNDATNAVLPDLHCGNNSAVDVAGDNLSAIVTDDFDGQSRAALTPHDIGADADNFTITGVQTKGAVSASSIYALGEGVLITEAAGNTAAIYTVAGQLVKSMEIASDNVFVSLSKGFYIISVKDQKVKVLVK